MTHKFRELIIWNIIKAIAIDIYLITKQYPSDEKFGLINGRCWKLDY